MKKSLPFVMLSALLISFLIMIEVNSENAESKSDDAIYETEAMQAEAQKKFMALRIIELDSSLNVVDVYGDPLVIGQWYVRSNATKILFPIEGRDRNKFHLTGMFGESELPLVNKKYRAEEVRMKVYTGGSTTIAVQVEVILTNSTVSLID